VKHLLLILISLLLLSSPVISYGQSGKTLYGWGDFPDYVWKEFGDRDTHPIYKGEVEIGIKTILENGVPNGLGFLIFPNGDKYVGEWKDGKPNGQGTTTFLDGRKYVGEYKDGKRNGQGTFTLSNGNKYVGEWKDGERNGQGTFTWSIGNKFVGEWKDNQQWNGTGYYKTGTIFGKVVNGKMIKP
jgi:hypothetical protein